MYKNKTKINYPKKYKLNKIKITESAIKQILFLINQNSENKGIKLEIKKSGCAGFKYHMKLVKKTETNKEDYKNEKYFFYKNIFIYFSFKDIQFLEGITIDFTNDKINKIFKFHHPKLKKFCGCGESFTIDTIALPT